MGTLEIDAIKDYLISVGCKIEYPILVNAFKKHLYNPDPNIQCKVRTQFKDYVNRLSTVSLENNMKFINLRPEFRPADKAMLENGHKNTSQLSQDCLSQSTSHSTNIQPQKPLTPHMTPVKPNYRPPKPTQQQSMRPQPQQVLRSPSMRHEKLDPLRVSRAQTFHTPSPNHQYQQQYQYQHQNQQTPSHTPIPPPIPAHHRLPESDSSSLQPIDPLRRRWAIEACNCNYNNLVRLLREDPKLAACKDIVNGYTALHWAAKFNHLDIIKLIAGTYGVSTNLKSSAGHTPLHVAFMFNRLDAANLLIKSYQSNTDIRDHSGKKPRQCWRKPSTIEQE